MGVGHAAVGIAAARAVPRLNAGWLVFASVLADFLLGVFAWLGLERADVPPDYASKHYLVFTFPYSHGFAALLVWSVVCGLAVASVQRVDRRQVFIVVAIVAFSHFVLDALVHVAGLPLAGQHSPKIGLGLWTHMPLELGLETLMSVAAVAIFWKPAAVSALSRYGVASFMALLCAMTWTQLWMTTPPVAAQLIPSWVVSPILFGAIVYALDRKRVAATRAAVHAPG
jgi:hypothetical protein